MVQEVFQLMMTVHEGMHIISLGLQDGTVLKGEVIDDGNRQTVIEIELVSYDIGFAEFIKHRTTSYVYNNEKTGETHSESRLCIPYSNINFVEFSDEEE